jgi:hypothetical protein
MHSKLFACRMSKYHLSDSQNKITYSTEFAVLNIPLNFAPGAGLSLPSGVR